MGKLLVLEEPRKVGYEEYEERALASNEVRIQTLYTGISAGTELQASSLVRSGTQPIEYLKKKQRPLGAILIYIINIISCSYYPIERLE